MGTASSLMGVSEALKPHGVFIQAHEPASSAAISGGRPGPFLNSRLDGHGDAALGPGQGRPRRADRGRRGARDERRLGQDEGIFAGISTGANVVGAHRLADRLGPGAVIVTLAVDTGYKYLSVSPYDDG
jgi:cysteine synthase A